MYRYAGAWVRFHTARFNAFLRSNGIAFKTFQMKGAKIGIHYDLIFFKSDEKNPAITRSGGNFIFSDDTDPNKATRSPILEIRGSKYERFISDLRGLTPVYEVEGSNKEGSINSSSPAIGMIIVLRRIGSTEYLKDNPGAVGNPISVVDFRDEFKMKSDREAKILINRLFDVGGIPETVSLIADPPLVLPEDTVEEIKETVIVDPITEEIVTPETVEIEGISEEVVETVVDTQIEVKPDALASLYQKVLLKSDSLSPTKWYGIKGPGKSVVKKAMDWRLKKIRSGYAVVENYNSLMTEAMRDNAVIFEKVQISEEIITKVYDALAHLKVFLIERMVIENDPSYKGHKLSIREEFQSIFLLNKYLPTTQMGLTDIEKLRATEAFNSSPNPALFYARLISICNTIKEHKEDLHFLAPMKERGKELYDDVELFIYNNIRNRAQTVELVREMGLKIPVINNRAIRDANDHLNGTYNARPDTLTERRIRHEEIVSIWESTEKINIGDSYGIPFWKTYDMSYPRMTFLMKTRNDKSSEGYFWGDNDEDIGLFKIIKAVGSTEDWARVLIKNGLITQDEVNLTTYRTSDGLSAKKLFEGFYAVTPPLDEDALAVRKHFDEGVNKVKKSQQRMNLRVDKYIDPLTGAETLYPRDVMGMIKLINDLGVDVYMYSSSSEFNSLSRYKDEGRVATSAVRNTYSRTFANKLSGEFLNGVMGSLKGIYWGLKVCMRYPSYDLKHLHIIMQKARAHALTLKRHPNDKAYGSTAVLTLSYTDEAKIAIHEIMHTLEYLNPSVRDFTTAHFAKTIVSPDATGTYAPGEPIFELNNSFHKYTGKMYHYEIPSRSVLKELYDTPEMSDATEMVTMCLEQFGSSPDSLAQWSTEYPEYYLFAYNIITGKVQIPESEEP